MYEQINKNSVESSNQLMKNEYVKIHNSEKNGVRVMFAGNSITLHGIKEDIGWMNEWGMAASEKEKDYVHLVMKKILQKDAEASFCICQVAEWERNYKTGRDTLGLYSIARDYGADIIIARFVENCPWSEDFDADIFKKEYIKLIDYLNSTGKAKIILTSSFWKHPANAVIEEIAEEKGFPYAELSDLGECEDMKAIGLFEHEGVANHPGDKGMEAIAERILEVM